MSANESRHLMMRLKECHRLAYRTHAVIAVELVVEVRVQAHGAVRHSVAVVVRAAGVDHLVLLTLIARAAPLNIAAASYTGIVLAMREYLPATSCLPSASAMRRGM